MPYSDFLIILVSCAVTMFICRVLPLFILKGRELPRPLTTALEFIPPAAFAALVTNDLFSPGMFDAGFWPAGAPLIAAAIVVAVGVKTKSLVWCIVVGLVAYAALLALPL